MRLLAAAAVIFSSVAFGQNYTIRTFAGGQLPENMLGVTASLGRVEGVARDVTGNMYLSLPSFHIVVRLDAAGHLTRIAGNGIRGFSGDNGPATSAQLNQPNGLAIDSAGSLYIADSVNHRIRRVSGGVISTVAGNGSPGFSGDNSFAVSAQLTLPSQIAFDSAGNYYIADNSRVRKVSNGVITTVAGNGTAGFSGDNGPATAAQVSAPSGIALDAAGNLYISDRNNHRIRMVTSGIITTVAGNGIPGFGGDNGPALSGQLNQPTGIAVDSVGNLYVLDFRNNRIRKVSNGVITTVAGDGTQGFSSDNIPAISAPLQLTFRAGMTTDTLGNIYFADNARLRKVSNGMITTVAGGGSAVGDGGSPINAQLIFPTIAISSGGNAYISDYADYRVRKVSNGVITTVAGNGTLGTSGDNGPAVSAQLFVPLGMAVDKAENLYIADAERIRLVSNGSISTVAGTGVFGFGGDNGPATSAQLGDPSGLALDSAGNLYIADQVNDRIRKVSNGIITTVAGTGTAGFSGDNGLAVSAQLRVPIDIAIDSAGDYYIADLNNHRIRKVSNGVITTVAGNGTRGFSGDGGPAVTAQLDSPYGIAVDAAGNLYIAEFGNQRIRKVSNGIINTIAGNGTSGFSGDQGPATSAQLNQPTDVAVDAAGNVYVAEDTRVRVLVPSSPSCTFLTSPLSSTTSPSGGNITFDIQTTPGCQWGISGLPPWIAVAGVASSAGPASVTLVVAANSGTARGATILIAGVPVTVNQAAAAGCLFSINPGGQAFLAAGGSGTINVTAGQGCTWTVTSSIPWVTISGASTGTGNGSIVYLVGANTGAARSSTISIAGLSFTIEQASASISGFTTAGSMAHIAASGGWSTTFTFVNPSLTPTPIRVNFFADNGSPLTLTVNFPQTGQSGVLASTIDRTLGPGAVLQIVASGQVLQPVLTGWAQVLANGNINAFAAFRLTTATFDNQAVVPLETRNAGAYLVGFDNTGGFVAGIALANTSAQAGNVGIIIRDDTGATVSSSTITLAGMAHTSFVLPNSYGVTAGKRGTVEFVPPPGMQISTLGIQFNTATGGFSTIPALTK